MCRRRMAAEAAVFIVGWVRRIATISRRIVREQFCTTISSRLLSLPLITRGCFSRFGWLPRCSACSWGAPEASLPPLIGANASEACATKLDGFVCGSRRAGAAASSAPKRVFGLVRAPSLVLDCGLLPSVSLGLSEATVRIARPRTPCRWRAEQKQARVLFSTPGAAARSRS